jgi:hypothetical protein
MRGAVPSFPLNLVFVVTCLFTNGDNAVILPRQKNALECYVERRGQ